MGEPAVASDQPVQAQKLRDLVKRIERLENDKAGVMEDIRSVYSEAKSDGFDTKTLRKIVALRKKDAKTVQEEELLLETYKRALGMEF